MSIIVEHITKKYGSQKALDNVSFSINRGEVVGLLGPNGAGKSTMMKIITCYIPPTEGLVTVCGFDIFEQSIEVRRKVGYLPENNPLYTDLYVREYLEFIAGIYRLKNIGNRVTEMIEMTGLEIEQKKKIGALSKGYRQRVGLAQALIHDPEVLILDEPTSGLDPNQLVEIRNLIREVGKEKTVMLSTHIMQEVDAVCDRAIIIDQGKIVADDSTANLSMNLSNQRVLRVEFKTGGDEEQLMAIPGVENVKRLSETEFEITSGTIDLREQIFQYAVQNGFAVLSMNQVERGISEVFQRLTMKKQKTEGKSKH
ncbi:MAG: gliding motility-associated ABC transporter ATP-binding subunit GldA [Bacteroidales bacterium]